MLERLNTDELGVVFSFLDCHFLQDTIRLISTSFNSLIISHDEFQKEFVKSKIQSMKSEISRYRYYVIYGPHNRHRMDQLYGPYLSLEKDYRKSFLELKEKFQKEIEQSKKERIKIANIRSYGKDEKELYQNFKEIKLTIKEQHLQPLRGFDVEKKGKSINKKVVSR